MAGLIGAAVLACAACCAGPLLGVVGGLGTASLLGSFWIPGLLAVTVLAGVVAAILLIRRHRVNACRLPADRVPVEIRASRPRDDERVLSDSGASAL